MKLIQIHDPVRTVLAGVLEEERIYPVTYEQKGLHSVLDLIQYASSLDMELIEIVEELRSSEPLHYQWEQIDQMPDRSKPHLLVPIHAPEVWACGVTYKKSAEFRDEDAQASKGIYDYVYSARRPELFFKATASRCTGSNDFIGLRPDSRFTAIEPELAVVLNSKKKILGYTVANDVSAWDIERENPLYLPQSKVFRGCCALGPALVTADEIQHPGSLSVSCKIHRDGQVIFSGETSVGKMKRKIEELIDFLFLANPIPDGTVLLTGTGIIQTEAAALREGDRVEITIPEIGTLKNIVKLAE